MKMQPDFSRETEPAAFRKTFISYLQQLQNTICVALEKADEKARFKEDTWEREMKEGGGGRTRTFSGGSIFEKAGVNSSVVYGPVSDMMRSQLNMNAGGSRWFACGLSLVIHPVNPYVPTVHANWRYFEITDDAGTVCDQWFGGGADLTPYYLFEEDAKHFHLAWKQVMDPFSIDLYPAFKKNCDNYFVNSHRNGETRGIGGVFYDHLRPGKDMDLSMLYLFQQCNGNAFLSSYLPIVEKRKDHPFSDREKNWQEIRRGRYVEFNLLHDRGTVFGLKTNGRTESILMSLPPRARWVYDYQPIANSEEDKLLQVCLHPVNWI
ncbi:MAG: hypothetical protein RLZZ28_2711 [Bacteroidota bacterium]|jgi:coproporphyrinogen III oxidase